jgi:hypothetical protein
MKTDRFGLTVSTDKQAVIDALDHFSTQLLLNGKEARKICDAVIENPDNLLLNCHSGIIFLFAHDDADSVKILPFLHAAEKLLSRSNDREKLYYQAALFWYQKDHGAALGIYEKITEQWPRDCVAAKLAEWMFHCMGQADDVTRFLRMTTKMYPHNKKEPGFLATHSFALELNKHYDQSLEIAEEALALEALTPWAHHTFAHTLIAKGNIDHGIKILETYKPLWVNILPTLCGHLTWHLNLFYLANLDKENILAQFSPGVWGNMPELSLEQADAISLLWRMEMADMPQDDLLKKVTEKLGNHVYQQYIGFDTVHYVYALARTGNIQAANQVISDAVRYANTLQSSYKNLWLNICVPLFEGVAAFAQAHYQKAYTHLAPILPMLAKVGGSDAQIEAFYQTALVSLLRSSQKDKAQTLIKQYLPHYLLTPLGKHWNVGLS